MDFDYDLFISYKSEDREWAARLYADLRRWYPFLKIFWDRSGIPPGVSFRPVLEDAIRRSAHFVLFWSGLAAQSGEVLDEAAAFKAHVDLQPAVGKGTRTRFYVPLEGRHEPLEGTQGFPEFRNQHLYTTASPDRGTAKLTEPAALLEWERMVRSIGDTCLTAYPTQPVTLSILTMNESILPLLDPILNLRVMPGPTLNELLTSIETTLEAVKQRYGPSAFDWRPFGTAETVIDFMERLRLDANAGLSPQYQFHWVAKDFYAEVTRPTNTASDVRRLVEQLGAAPSVAIVDQLSLYNPVVYQVFAQLGEYAHKEQAVIISLAPAQTNTTDFVLRSIEGHGAPVLDAYFRPQIPAGGTFARCGVNLQHPLDIQRLIRSSLGLYYVQQRKLQADPVTKGG